jgi:AraC-like DNA-binding protein
MSGHAGDVLDDSKVKPLHSFHGLALPVRSFGGARALRIVHPAHQVIPEHRHDWPLLTLPALGGYMEDCEEGSVAVSGPAAILHPPGRCHANCIHASGMETLSIEFDPGWIGLKAAADPLDRSFYWLGGVIPIASRALARVWIDPLSNERQLRSATADFVMKAVSQPLRAAPRWLDEVRRELARAERPTASAIARRLGLHPRWLSHAYRSAVGEGLHDTLRRRRLEQAVQLLRATDQSIAEIAASAGFCAHSHLNRTLSRLLGRTP